MRAILGLIKGGVVGGDIGYALYASGADGGVVTYAACALVGALVGIVCGRAPWRSDTIWTPVVKAIVGGLIGAGLAAAGRYLPEATLPKVQGISLGTHGAPFLAAAVGVLYGIFVEIDDGGSRPDKERAAGKKRQAG
jgi:hypothetical protein